MPVRFRPAPSRGVTCLDWGVVDYGLVELRWFRLVISVTLDMEVILVTKVDERVVVWIYKSRGKEIW